MADPSTMPRREGPPFRGVARAGAAPPSPWGTFVQGAPFRGIAKTVAAIGHCAAEIFGWRISQCIAGARCSLGGRRTT